MDILPYYEIDSSKPCKLYGVSALAAPPFKYLLFPFYLLIGCMNEKAAERYSHALRKLVFVPVALLQAALFGVLNIMMAPWGYFYTLARLLGTAFDKRGDLCGKLGLFLEFIVSGAAFILVSLLVDPLKFFINLFNEDRGTTDTVRTVSTEALAAFA